MAHKTAYQCLVCGKALSHSDSMVLSAPGTPKVLVHRGRCFSKYKGRVRHGQGEVRYSMGVGHGAARPSPLSNAQPVVSALPPRVVLISPAPPVVSSKDEAPSGVLSASVPEVLSASEGDTSTANSSSVPANSSSVSPIPEHTTTPTYTNTFSARVLEYRKTHRLSQLELAKRVGYKNASTVCAIEKGNISKPTERVYDIGTLLGLLRHEVDILLTKRERIPSDTAPTDSVPPPSTIHHYNGISKSSSDTDLTTNFARCNSLPADSPYQAAAQACKALVLHILAQPTMPDMALVHRLVRIGWGMKDAK